MGKRREFAGTNVDNTSDMQSFFILRIKVICREPICGKNLVSGIRGIKCPLKDKMGKWRGFGE